MSPSQSVGNMVKPVFAPPARAEGVRNEHGASADELLARLDSYLRATQDPQFAGLSDKHMHVLQLHCSDVRMEWYPGTRDREVQQELIDRGFITSALTPGYYTISSNGAQALAILRDRATRQAEEGRG